MNALVTGGGGFLGGAIVRRLMARGDSVRSLARGHYPELEALGVKQFRGDLADPAAVAAAAAGCDVVFHVAARTSMGGRYEDFHRTNVLGTENVLIACLEQHVPRLVYTSSPSVVFAGQDMEGVDESTPYPEHFDAAYPQTKAQAEQTVLAANSPALATVALRPHLIWGPGDTQLLPRILARARAGRLRRIGRANKLIDTIYIDNAADAHLLAADRLVPGSVVCGRAYFLSQGEPVPMWDMINRMLDAAGLGPVKRTLSVSTAYALGWMMEKVYGVLRLSGEPPLTRFLVQELSTAHWFNISAARRDLGYVPGVSIEEGLRRLREALARG
jgi:nucleoside-diphosphate-sugar epimerase